MVYKTVLFQGMCDKLKDKKIVCWGIGNYFKAFWDSVSGYVSEAQIPYLIDNNSEKQRKGILVAGKMKNIVSPAFFLEHWQDEVLIITTVHYGVIMDSISGYMENKEYYIYPLIVHRENWAPVLLNRRSREPLIPAIIHYCWFGDKPIPKEELQYINGWKSLCPDFEFICWNETNFDVMSTQFTRWAYENKKWAYLSDYVRMYALFEYGGFYFDTDVEFLKSPNELRYQDGFWSMEETGCANSGSGIGMIRQNPLIEELLNIYKKISYQELKEGKGVSVNAERESDLLRKYGFKANNCFQIIENIAMYPSEFFSPKLIGSEEILTTRNTFAIHHFNLSWLKK